MHEPIRKAIAMRRACLWRMRGKRPDDNFAGSIGRLEVFLSSFPPQPSEGARKAFREGILYRDFLRIVPGNKQGDKVIDELNKALK